MQTGREYGASTITGLNVESKVDLLTLLAKIPNYRIVESRQNTGHEIYYSSELVA